MSESAKAWLIVALVVFVGWLYLRDDSDGPGPSPDPGRVDAGAVEAGQEAVEVWRRDLSAALRAQAEAAAGGEFESSTEFAQFLESKSKEAMQAAVRPMDERFAQTVGDGEWDAAEAAAVSRGFARGIAGE